MLVEAAQTEKTDVPKAISVKNLTKIYGNGFKAVDNISFDVYEGEIFGLLGPNGAGKTTTIRILTTMIPKSSGSAEIAGIDVSAKPKDVRQLISYVPQMVSVDGDLTAYENLLVFANLFYVDRTDLRSRIDAALEYMELLDRKNDLVKHFSGGMMRRLEIAQALVNRPKLMILDEPSIGLDPSSRRQITDYIKRVNREFKTTVLITTHDMVEADELCDKIAIMNAGKISIIGNPEELKKSVGGDIISVTFSEQNTSPLVAGTASSSEHVVPTDASSTKDQRLSIVVPTAIGQVISNDGVTLRLLCENGERSIPRVIDYFEKNYSFSIDAISLHKPSLEDVFVKYAKTTLDSAGSFTEARATRRAIVRRSR